MKRLFWLSMAFMIPALMIACGKKGSNTDNTIATAPLTNQCLGTATTAAANTYSGYNYYGYNYGNYNTYPYSQQTYPQTQATTCNNTVYGQYYGFAPYYGNVSNYTYGTTMNLCECGSGWRPVYHNEIGLGCATNTLFTTVAFGAFYYTLSANNSQWVNIPQISNTQGYPSSGSCYQNVAQACWTDVANSCGAGNTCIPSSGGSRLGICARQ